MPLTADHSLHITFFPCNTFIDLYLQKVNGQSAAGGPGATGTARSRSTLNGPRPPNFGSKVSSRKIFQDGSGASPSMSPSSPMTPTTTVHIESAVKHLGLSSAPSLTNQARAPSPILESMGESGPPPAPVIMESMGSDDYGPPENPMFQQQIGGMPNGPPFQHYASVSGFVGGAGQSWPGNGYGLGPQPHPHPPPHTTGYSSQTVGPGQFYSNGNHSLNNNYYDSNIQHQQQQQQLQPQYPVHLSQEQYLQLQQQQYQQQQEYLRQKHSQNAAAHGYYPTNATSSGHMQNPGVATVLAQPVPIPHATVSKTITPRIVPIVDIPKYTTINPPKTEIETLNNEQDDDDWAPEPPPRDPPKKSPIAAVAMATTANTADVDKPMPKPPSRPHTPIDTAFILNRPLTPKTSIPSPKSVTSEIYPASASASSSAADSPRSKLLPHPIAPTVADTPGLVDEISQEDRIPMPPPREFRRKSTASPTILTAPLAMSNKTTSTGIFSLGPSSSSTTPVTSVGSSIFARPDSASSTTSSSFRAKATTPTPGTVRANSAKFNAMAATGIINSNPKTVSSKGTSSTIGSLDATATATSNPWTSKAVDTLRRNSLSKDTGPSTPETRKSLDLPASSSSSISSDSSYAKNQAVFISPEVYVDKELPPIRAATPQSRSSTPRVQTPIPVDYDSKCILIEEDKLAMIPRADDESKEILVEQEEELKPVAVPVMATPKSVTPRTKPARNGGDHVVGGSSLFVCASCDEPISGTMITAMGKRWHSDHFVCSVCDLNLEHVQFFHKDGHPYCHFDYHDKFSPKCGHCNIPIENVNPSLFSPRMKRSISFTSKIEYAI